MLLKTIGLEKRTLCLMAVYHNHQHRRNWNNLIPIHPVYSLPVSIGVGWMNANWKSACRDEYEELNSDKQQKRQHKCV